jgi:hypothetical protein
MRKVLLLLLLLSLTLPVASSEKINFLATVDLAVFDAIWEKHISIKSSFIYAVNFYLSKRESSLF